MIATRHDGSKQPLQIGSPLVGARFQSVEVTAGDLNHPRFMIWFLDTVIHCISPAPAQNA